MKNDIERSIHKRLAAGVCAVLIIMGSTAGLLVAHSSDSEEAAPEEQSLAAPEKTSSDQNGTISAGGTVTSSQLSDELGMKDTSVRLTVDEVLVESGDSVTAGTRLYRIAEDSLAKAEKTLLSELGSAENALLEKSSSYNIEQNKAHALYESELMLGRTAQNDYNSSLTSLNKSLQEAYDAYAEALDTIANNPSDISSKQSEVDSLQEDIDSKQEEKDKVQTELDEAKKEYNAASESYDSAYSDYETAAGVVTALEKALGLEPTETETPDKTGSRSKTTSDKEKTESSSKKTEDTSKSPPDTSSGSAPANAPSKQFDSGDIPSDMEGFKPTDTDGAEPLFSEKKQNAAPTGTDSGETMDFERPDSTDPSGFSGGSFSGIPDSGYPDKSSFSGSTASENGEKKYTEEELQQYAEEYAKEYAETYAAEKLSAAMNELYQTACEERKTKKEALEKAEAAMKEREEKYNELSEKVSGYAAEIEEAQNSKKDLEKEINSLNTSLTKAKNSLSKLRTEYNSLNASYEKDKLELKNTLDKDNASYENAEYHYKITCSTLDDELAEAQKAYDTASENYRIFEESLAEGYLYASRDGVVYSTGWAESRSADITAPFVYYVDENGFETTVELDQNDVTKISIGDSVMLYSSETGIANGKVTAISEGTAKSLADVRFNVTVSADDGADLYVGQSVNVYFNSGDMDMSKLADFNGSSEGGSKSGRSFGGGRPDFSGGMPEGFDPSAMPGFGRGKDD